MPSSDPRPALASQPTCGTTAAAVGQAPARGLAKEPVRRAGGGEPDQQPARRGGGRRRPQFDRPAVRRVPVGVDPGVLSRLQRDRIGQALVRDQALQGGQPVLVVARAVVGFAASGGRPQFVRQGRGPLGPGEVAALRERDRERERLGLPRLGEHRAVLVTRQPERRQALGLQHLVRPARGGHPTSRVGPCRAARPARPTTRGRRSAPSRRAAGARPGSARWCRRRCRRRGRG